MELENAVQTAPQQTEIIPVVTARQTALSLKGLIDQYRLNATSYVDISKAETVAAMPALMADGRVLGFNDDNGMPLEDYPFGEFIFGLSLRGTVGQKAALVKNLPLSVVFSQPEMRKVFKGPDGFELGKNFIETHLSVLAAFFGVNVPGAIDELAESIFDTYGGFSCLDIVFFMDRVKKGKYRTEYQNVAVRGLNAEFIMSWLLDYDEERATVHSSLNNAAKGAIIGRSGNMVNITNTVDFQRIRAAEILLEDQAEQMRKADEQALTEAIQREYWTKKVAVTVKTMVDLEDGYMLEDRTEMQWVMCEPNDPKRERLETNHMRVDRPGATFKRLVRFLFNFVVVKNEAGEIVGKTGEDMAQDLAAYWREEYEARPSAAITYEQYARAQAAAFIYKFHASLEKIGAVGIIRSGFAGKLGGTSLRYNEEAGKRVTWIYQRWAEYLRFCIETETVPLKKPEFVLMQAIRFCQVNGMRTPTENLLAFIGFNKNLNEL